MQRLIENLTETSCKRFMDFETKPYVKNMLVGANATHKWGLSDKQLDKIVKKAYARAITKMN